MKVTALGTTRVVELRVPGQGIVPARLWEATTESGIRCWLWVTRVQVREGDDQSQFQRELTECTPPSVETAAIPLRMVL